MKKKSKKNTDVATIMVQIQEQLAALDQKLETFITKSLTELAQVLAQKQVPPPPRPVAAPSTAPRPPEPPRRPMFAVICFNCGKDTEIPFRPTPGRPVYCKECFAKRKAGNLNTVTTEARLPPAPATPVEPPKAAVKAKRKTPPAKKSAIKKPTSKKKKK